MIKIHIEDDFSLEKIAISGQCFRVKRFENGVYRFIKSGHVLYIKKIGEGAYEISCGMEEWRAIWEEYFDLGRDYGGLRNRAEGKSEYVRLALNCGQGLRVLRQDPWEMLITFIISQRKSIPAISKSVEALARRYGRPVKTDYETVYTFPGPKELSCATEEELSACGLGYRVSYVQDAVRQAVSGLIDLEGMAQLEDEQLFDVLLGIRGVGRKVANCVCLFGYGRMSRVPVDVWISRVIEEECQGKDPFPLFGAEAGIIQQFVFYYKRNQRIISDNGVKEKI